MSKTKKPRKAYRPKGVITNPIYELFGGMSSTHVSSYQRTAIMNHRALAELAQGRGGYDEWNRIVGASNMALVMAEQGIGDEYRPTLVEWHDVMLKCGVRSVKTERFLFTGEELKVVNEGMAIHDAQLVNVRAIDVDRAAAEVERRLRYRINSTSVMGAIRQEQMAA